jgi:endonuclease V-like protein UPF0215 family
MSISYQPKDATVQAVQLKVQELVVKKSDTQLVTVDGLDVTINFKEPVVEVLAALICDDSVGLYMIAQSGIAISGNEVTLTLSAALADEDTIIVKYVLA